MLVSVDHYFLRPPAAGRRPPSVRPSVLRRAKRARRILGRDFAPPTTSFALGFVRVSFPRANSVGFSFNRLIAGAEMSDPVCSGLAVR